MPCIPSEGRAYRLSVLFSFVLNHTFGFLSRILIYLFIDYSVIRGDRPAHVALYANTQQAHCSTENTQWFASSLKHAYGTFYPYTDMGKGFIQYYSVHIKG